jgi:hypothetical protein
MAAAVSIDKVGRWGGTEETEIRQLLAVSPDAIRYFSAMKALLHGDLKEAGQFFEGTAPNYNRSFLLCHAFALSRWFLTCRVWRGIRCGEVSQ